MSWTPSRGARIAWLLAAIAAGALYVLTAIDAVGMGQVWEALAWVAAAVGTALAAGLAARSAPPPARQAARYLAAVPLLWCLGQLVWQAESLVGGGMTVGAAELVALASVAPLLAWLVLVGAANADRRLWLAVDLVAIAAAVAAIALALLGSLVVGMEPVRALATIAMPALYISAAIGGIMTLTGRDLRRDTVVAFACVIGAAALVSVPWIVWMTATTPVPVALAANVLVPTGYLLLGAGALRLLSPPIIGAGRARTLERRRAVLPLAAVWLATAALPSLGTPRAPWLSAIQLGLTLLAVAVVLTRQGLLLRERDALLVAETRSRTAAEAARRQALAAMRDAHAALDRLAEAEERYRSLLERIPAMVYLDRIDPASNPERDGFVGSVYFSPQTAETLDVEPERLVADPDLWDRMIHPDDAEAAAEGAREFYRTGLPLDQTYRMIRPDGRVIWVNQRAELLGPDADGRFLAQGVVVDITERQLAEERLRETAKMDAVARLAGGIAHDFNNLLTIIGGYASLLREEFAPVDPRRDEAAAIEQAAGTAASLVAKLLAYGRRQMATRRPLDLATVITRALPMLRRAAGEQIEVHAAVEPDLPWIDADPAQIEQVILNLVLNAYDAMPEGGRLDVELRHRVLDDAEARSRPGLHAGPHAELVVRDTGIGMDAATRDRVFEPFFTTKSAEHGGGLGLASVYGIVHQSDGYIEVDSAPGQGSTFRVLFPAADPEPAAHGDGGDPPVPTATDEPRIVHRILLVDDEPAVRALAAAVLRRAGHEVVPAASGDEALRVLAEMPVRPGLLLTDVMMPGLTGPELAARVRVTDPGMPVLFMSGYAEDAIDLGEPLGGDGFVAKPFDPATLLQTVAKTLAGSPPTPPLRSRESPAG
ncbi:MAG TPA: ATP-binding protein [Candidatus Limnocylindrales bacterium]|nr:ATP-binding protein [Candidatus Limnocylindrales bacterium]